VNSSERLPCKTKREDALPQGRASTIKNVILPGDAGGASVYSHIVVPVDLAHEDKLERTLKCAADLASHWSARATYVGVTSSLPGKLGHNPTEYSERLARFAAAQAELHGIETGSHAAVSHDPAIDLDKTLLSAIKEIGGDLVVMQSHIPNITDYVWASHGETVAGHTDVSVLLVRG
jgi:nucleotide-binding universal stress UspA family protein